MENIFLLLMRGKGKKIDTTPSGGDGFWKLNDFGDKIQLVNLFHYSYFQVNSKNQQKSKEHENHATMHL